MKKIKNLITAVLPAGVCVLTICLMAGGAFAYFSGKADTLNNRFSIVKGEKDEDGAITIEEPLWDTTDEDGDGTPDAAQRLEPGTIVDKNPSVKSNVDYDGWVVMKVSVPKLSASMKKGDPLSKMEVFDLIGLNEQDFVLLDSVTDGEESAQYYYGYKKILKAGASTEDLFSRVQVKNFAVVKNTFAGSIDLDAEITQSVDPATGTLYPSVADAYEAMGGKF